jgi:hypothetical protein
LAGRHGRRRRFIAKAKVFPLRGILQKPNPPYPPFIKGGNDKELLLKSPFGKGGFGGILKIATEINFWQTL